MKWFRMYHEARTDEKLKSLTDAQFRMWFRLMCFANEQTLRGFIPTRSKRLMAVEVAQGDVGLYEETLLTLSELEIVEVSEDGIFIVHWDKRQFDSDNSTSRWKQWKNKQDTNVGQTPSKQHSNSTPTDNKQKSTPPDTDTDNRSKEIKDIVLYLNEKCGTKYRHTTDSTRKHINARLDDGFTVDDFKTVIDKKAAEWLNDPKWSQYLRPETLFVGKFESYLNAPWPAGATKPGESEPPKQYYRASAEESEEVGSVFDQLTGQSG